MISAKLIKSLEKEGFELEFPDYNSKEEIIIEILKEKNPRLNLALPILLKKDFDYEAIAKSLSKLEKKELKKIILISKKIYEKENIDNSINQIIKNNKINSSFSKEELNNYYDSFKESSIRIQSNKQKDIEKQSKLRLNLDLNKSLSILFSPAKIKIMEKIFNHENLTNTELKYYYRSISNINRSVLNPSLQNYLSIIEKTKKEHH